jgi:hypothetical protein
MTMEYNFTGIRIQNSTLTPVDWHLEIDLLVSEKKGKTKKDIEYEAGLIYQKIYFWMETNLPSIVVVDTTKEEDLYIANLSSNIMMYCPGNPGDDLVIQLLHAKLVALSTEHLMIGEIHLKGSDTSIKYSFDCVDGNYGLPILVSEYFTDGDTLDETPWWTRNDGFCFEFLKPDDLDITDEEKEELNNRIDPMDEFYRIIGELKDTSFGVVKEPARIVQIEKWKPKKV